MIDKEQLQEYYEFATDLAWRAGRLTLGYYQTGVRTEWKSDDTPVTRADREAEQLVRQSITERYPDHAIVGEEYGADDRSDATHRWFVDPIDGTKSFMRGVPLYSVLLGLEVNGRIVVGVACFPALNEMVSAADGLGCWWNGRRAHASAETRIERSIVAHIDTASFKRISPEKGAGWERLQDASYYNAGWCDAYGYMLVATGRAEVMLDPIVSVWDCSPFPVIMREAGAYFGDWHGNETIYAEEALACSPALLPTVMKLLNGE